jgi:hypothetical protein
MRYIVSCILILILQQPLLSQQQDVWIRFVDTTTELSGYKDLQGNTRITPRFTSLTVADSFYNIVGVSEEVNKKFRNYYLLKNGKKLGFDSTYIFDFAFDCESEGKILFHDRKKDRVGFLDKNGAPLIPAMYNYASSFRNGVAIALRNARRKCHEGTDTVRCEHLGWTGGELVLINEKNEVLADKITADMYHVNWYSMKVNAISGDTGISINIPGKNGLIYSFVDYEKEFMQWYKTVFLDQLSQPGFKEMIFPEVAFYGKDGMTSLGKDEFLQTYPAKVSKEKFRPLSMYDMSISEDPYFPFIFEPKKYTWFHTACGEQNRYRFPVFSVLYSYYKRNTRGNMPVSITGPSSTDFYKYYDISRQDNFHFVKTPGGYKLFCVAIEE